MKKQRLMLLEILCAVMCVLLLWTTTVQAETELTGEDSSTIYRALQYRYPEYSSKTIYQADGYCYIILDDGTAGIVYRTFSGANVVAEVEVPETLGGHKVSTILQWGDSWGANAFVEKIILPDTLKIVDKYAFFGLYGIKEIVVPEGVQEFHTLAIRDCDNLTKIVIESPDCKIVKDTTDSAGWYMSNNVKICGYQGSTAETLVSIMNSWKAEVDAEDGATTGEYQFEALAKCSQIISTDTSAYTKVYGDKAFTIKAVADTKLQYKSSNIGVVTVSAGGKVTIKGAGKATITLTAESSAKYLSAVKKISITVKPKQASLSKVSTPAKKQLKLTWKKDSKASGYEIQYSTNSSFKGAKTKTIKTNKTTAITLKKLTSNKKYYVRIRSYSTTGSKTKIYGAWSTKLKQKVK
jgi:hypothetical protein